MSLLIKIFFLPPPQQHKLILEAALSFISKLGDYELLQDPSFIEDFKDLTVKSRILNSTLNESYPQCAERIEKENANLEEQYRVAKKKLDSTESTSLLF